jgi:mRNA interferase MazF
MRGEIWDAHLPRAGDRPVVILAINRMITRLGAVAAVLVTGSEGPRETHVPLGPEAGLTEYPESYANATDLYTIPKPSLRRRRGRLDRAELAGLENAVRIYLGL